MAEPLKRLEIHEDVRAVDHCDEGCGLGTLQFDCPACGKRQVLYEGWWQYEDWVRDVRPEASFEIACEDCKTRFTVGSKPEERTAP
jgi:ribosomal protein S27E